MCTKMTAVLRGISHVTTKQHCKYATSVDIWNVLLKAVTHSELHVIRVQQEQRYTKAIIIKNEIQLCVKSYTHPKNEEGYVHPLM